jgi:HD-GYP domain-containing protein (c-di-GMP phosphodiesterase class II)
MTTERSYRAAVAQATACHELVRCAGTQFDPAVVDAFVAVIEGDDGDREQDAAQHAADHVRTLLAVGLPDSGSSD